MNHKAQRETEVSAVRNETSYSEGVIHERGCGTSHSTGEEANAGNGTGARVGNEANPAETLARAIDDLAVTAQAIASISSTFHRPRSPVTLLPSVGLDQEVETETTKTGEPKTPFAEGALTEPAADVFASVPGLVADAIDALIHASEALVGMVPKSSPPPPRPLSMGSRPSKSKHSAEEVSAISARARHQIQAATVRAVDAQSHAREVAVIEAEARAAEARYRTQEIGELRAEARCRAAEVGALAAETLTSIQDVENFIKALIAVSQTENFDEDRGE